jgi:hypothetical protein
MDALSDPELCDLISKGRQHQASKEAMAVALAAWEERYNRINIMYNVQRANNIALRQVKVGLEALSRQMQLRSNVTCSAMARI